jgi:hypothetical protein
MGVLEAVGVGNRLSGVGSIADYNSTAQAARKPLKSKAGLTQLEGPLFSG